MSRGRLWLAVLVLALALFAFLLLRRGGSEPDAWRSTDAASSVAHVASAASSSDGAPAGHWGLMARLSAQADQAEQAARSEKTFLLDPRNDAAWCELGPGRVAQSARALQDANSAGAPRGPAAEALAETTEELLQRWATQLTARGDAASLATRDFLLANLDATLLQTGQAGSSERRSASAARLLQSGLSSSDGYTLRLAAQQACRKSPSSLCPQILRRWWQLEPGNLDAQLWRLSLLPESVDDSQWLPFLSHAAQSDQGESHRERYLQIVAQLMSVDGPAGLRTVAAIQLATAAVSLQQDSRLFFLADRCRQASSAEAQGVCLAVADRLYSQAFRPALARMVATVIGREQAANSELWRQREEEVRALRYWGREHRDLGPQDLAALNSGSCAVQPMLRELLTRTVQEDELADMHESLNAKGLDAKRYLVEAQGKGR